MIVYCRNEYLTFSAHQDARQNVKLDYCEQNMCSMEITPFTLNKYIYIFFFWGGGQICNDEYTSKNSKNVDFDCIMKAFFDERN